MPKELNLQHAPINQLFLKYLLPALLAILVKSANIVIDMMFIGQGTGPTGLATVSLTMPFNGFFSAIAVMIGIGGSTLMSIQFGRNNHRQGQRIAEQSVMLILAIVGILALAGWVWTEEIVALLGADGALFQHAVDFLDLMFGFYLLHTLVLVATFFVLHDTNPTLPLIAMIAGASVNIILDYLLIIELSMGLKGAALASMAAQVTMLAVLASHCIRGRGHLRLRFSGWAKDNTADILKTGSPAFFLEMAGTLAMFTFNFVLLNHYSEMHLAASGITMSIGVTLMFFLGSIGQACQPIISYNHGAGLPQRIRQALVLGMRTSVLLGLLLTALILPNLDLVIAAYVEESAELRALAGTATTYHVIAAALLGINLTVAAFFQAIKRPLQATLISLSRGFVGFVLGLLTLPLLFPDEGIWMLTPFAEALTLLLSLVLLKKYFNHRPGAAWQPQPQA